MSCLINRFSEFHKLFTFSVSKFKVSLSKDAFHFCKHRIHLLYRRDSHHVIMYVSPLHKHFEEFIAFLIPACPLFSLLYAGECIQCSSAVNGHFFFLNSHLAHLNSSRNMITGVSVKRNMAIRWFCSSFFCRIKLNLSLGALVYLHNPLCQCCLEGWNKLVFHFSLAQKVTAVSML